MSDQRSDLNDIRQIGDEAEQLQRTLEQGDAPKSHRTTSAPSRSRTSAPVVEPWSSGTAPGNQSANPMLLALIAIVLISPLIAVLWIGRVPSSTKDATPALTRRSSCGSRTSASGRWWPVLGPSSRSLLDRVKQSYCGDAYLNAEGAVQVASFGTRQAAEQFRDRISEATGVSFRVGRGR